MKAANVLETIGNTPHIRVNRLFGPNTNVWIKSGALQSRPTRSRIASRCRWSKMPKSPAICRKGGTIIEPTSGNTGVGLAMVAAVKGYKLGARDARQHVGSSADD